MTAQTNMNITRDFLWFIQSKAQSYNHVSEVLQSSVLKLSSTLKLAINLQLGKIQLGKSALSAIVFRGIISV